MMIVARNRRRSWRRGQRIRGKGLVEVQRAASRAVKSGLCQAVCVLLIEEALLGSHAVWRGAAR